MGFRFRKSVTLLPGVRLNLGRKNASIRVGGRGFGVTSGTSGTRVSAGLPGTGLSYSTKLSAVSRPASGGSIWRGVLIFALVLLAAWYVL
jgi:hypothetical protein